MIDTSAANSLLARFETYLAGVFHPVPFAFLRNAFIGGVLQRTRAGA
jgi:hypothetical protein